MDASHPRRIRSFVRRPGRLTTGQRRALDELMPKYGVDPAAGRIDLETVFQRNARRVLDIGFGDGGALATTSIRFPDIDYLGVEVHEPGIGHLLVALERAAIENVRVIQRDAVDVIAQMLPEGAFDAVNLFFPDPWPKKRHHKRRLVQPDFVRTVAAQLKPQGLFHIATDWANYAEHIRDVMAESNEFDELSVDQADAALAFRPPTKFEARGLKLGHRVVDYYYLVRDGDGRSL